MAVYCLAYILIALSIFIKAGKTPVEKKKNQCLFIFFVLFFIVGLRHPSMGIDLLYGSSNGYLGRFEYISIMSWHNVLVENVSNYEIGFIIFNKLLSLISNDSQVLLVGCAAFTFGLIFYEVYRKSDSPVMSAFVFMGLTTFLLAFSGLRQSIATSICFASISLIVEKKPLKFAVAILFACLFHYSAWIFLVAYPIFHFPVKKAGRMLTYLFPLLCFLFRYPLFRTLSSLLKDNAKVDNNNAIVLFLAFYLVYIFCGLFSGEQKELAGLKNIFFVACCIQAMAGVNSVVMRAGYYYMNSLILLLPMVTGRMRNRSNARILNVVISICFVLFGLYSIYRSGWAEANPHYFFWQQVCIC